MKEYFIKHVYVTAAGKKPQIAFVNLRSDYDLLHQYGVIVTVFRKAFYLGRFIFSREVHEN